MLIKCQKEQDLLDFVERELYYFVLIIKDGNCGPRVISVLIYGHQDNYEEIREMLYKT